MDDAVGYCAVMLPNKAFWQGFYIPPGLEREADKVILNLRTFTRHSDMVPSTFWPFEDVSTEDQPVLAGLLVVLLEMIHKREAATIGTMTKAIMRLTGCPYFYVVADEQPEGTRTTFYRIDEPDMERARAYLRALPIVTEIEMAFAEGKPRQ